MLRNRADFGHEVHQLPCRVDAKSSQLLRRIDAEIEHE
jgi:hypothetical protein